VRKLPYGSEVSKAGGTFEILREGNLDFSKVHGTFKMAHMVFSPKEDFLIVMM
jgi:hypothetical protein